MRVQHASYSCASEHAPFTPLQALLLLRLEHAESAQVLLADLLLPSEAPGADGGRGALITLLDTITQVAVQVGGSLRPVATPFVRAVPLLCMLCPGCACCPPALRAVAMLCALCPLGAGAPHQRPALGAAPPAL